ncbi:hypothetical protein BpHYR1_051370 [Brachionus plicatilis]|uniref:Uncharacterized protein n=1 Tax=Brachionus plicatilis TaxID=10195 RepID=A0A3M7RK96_BRAPC|nr:hypothetical protein BpHYR1_051370 [Brachionus plicatilis]
MQKNRNRIYRSYQTQMIFISKTCLKIINNQMRDNSNYFKCIKKNNETKINETLCQIDLLNGSLRN